MKVLYTVFNPQSPEDLSVLFSQENAKIMCDHINMPWKDDQGKMHQPDVIYQMGAETFRDEEWPTVQRLLGMMEITPATEEVTITEIKEMNAAMIEHRGLEKMPVQ